MIFSLVTTPVHSLLSIVQAAFWIWLHLFQFNVSNQSLGEAEDALNKPWRPIPAGLVSVSRARSMRWILVLACFATSQMHGVILVSVFFTLMSYLYDDVHLSGVGT